MVISPDEFKEQIKAELREALAYFIERQKLVAQAMMALGLDLKEVAEFKSLAWSSHSDEDVHLSRSNVEPEDSYLKKLFQVAKRASERNLPQSGMWRNSSNNEWRYFLHGGGCRLLHAETGEPIDWDCPDENSYDLYKFKAHLAWQLSFSERADTLPLSRTLEKDTLESLLHEIAL